MNRLSFKRTEKEGQHFFEIWEQIEGAKAGRTYIGNWNEAARIAARDAILTDDEKKALLNALIARK
jgi:hypothetical protein